MTSIDWMPNGGAPLLPKVSPYCVPVKMMELKRRPTLYDIRGSGFQLRHYKAPEGAVVPWDRVFFWPPKQVHVITDQEVYKPSKRKSKKKRVAKKGPKVVKAPPPPARDKKLAAKFAVHYDFQRVLRYIMKAVDSAAAAKRAVKAASADAATPPTRSIFSRPLTLPGAFSNDDDAAADVDAQALSAADDKAQPSLLAAIFNFGFNFFFGPRQSKRALEDDDVAGDAKRRRVGSDAQAPSRAEARPVAGKATRTTSTGATAPTHHKSTASAAQRRARIAPKASLLLCPPPSGSASVAGNAKIVKALAMLPPLAVPARPIAGRPTRKRADTPDPRAGTPPPAEPEASSAMLTPDGSPSSSRASSPEPSQSPTPAPEEASSKSKSSKSKSKSKSKPTESKSKDKSSKDKSSKDKLSSSKDKSSSSKDKSSSSKDKSSSSKDKSSSSKDKSSSSKDKSSSSKDKSSSSKDTSGSTSSSSDSSSSSAESDSSSSDSESSSSKSRRSHKASRSAEPAVKTGNLFNTGTNIMLFPYTLRWTREEKQVNPWDPRCPAAPDPRFPWAPAGSTWAQARPAPITLSSSTAASTISFKHPATFHDSARAPPAATSAPRDRAASPAPEDFSGYETEVDSGEETDDEED